MWKQIYNIFTKVITLASRTDKLEQALKDQQRELHGLTAFVQQLAYEVQRLKDEQKYSAEREASEREKFMLRVENQLLKAGRQLPPVSDDDKDKG